MHNINVEQTQEVVVQPSPGNSHQWLRPDKQRLEIGITMKFLPGKILMIQMLMICSLTKALGSTLFAAVCSYEHQHITKMMIK